MKKIIVNLILVTNVFVLGAQAELTRTLNGIVTDNTTGLQWQDNYSDNNTIKNATWSEAVVYCNSLSLEGANWRLPNQNELLSIVDYNKYNSAIKGTAFNNISISSDYWTSTTNAHDSSFAWYVRFLNGYITNAKKSTVFSVRCVR